MKLDKHLDTLIQNLGSHYLKKVTLMTAEYSLQKMSIPNIIMSIQLCMIAILLLISLDGLVKCLS